MEQLNQIHITCRTPFFLAKQKVNINPPDCIMIDSEKFKEALNLGHKTEIIFHIDYRKMSYNINETRSIKVIEVMKFLNENKAKLTSFPKSNLTVINLNRLNCKLVK